MEESLEPFSSDFSLGAWNDFGKFSENGFGESVDCLDGVALENNEKWDSYLGDGEYELPHTEQEAQAPYSFISSTTEENPSYGFEFSLGPACFVGQSSLEELESAKESNWTDLMGQQVCQGEGENYCKTLERNSKNETLSICEEVSTASLGKQVSEATDSICFVESNLSPSALEDLKGSTSAQGRKMTAEERTLMLYKRKLRNRESAAKTRKKRAKTLNQIGQELEELRQRADSLNERSSHAHRTEEENKKLVEENSHLRNVINQYAVELSNVRYKLKLYEDSASICQAGGVDNNEILSLPNSHKKNAAFDALSCDQRNIETTNSRETGAAKSGFASNEKEAEMLRFTPFSSRVTTLDVLEQVSNQHLGNIKGTLSGRDRRRAIAATNVFLRERSMN
ncbi:hypothetical protein Gasu2_26880 [Galdieria sulphuraria]|uniref:BZIP domain-containing protein n=1 Tax=Galdieria sulphuraria TaxID=130081 RepID=M2Y320_GALSU|nr:uncharacterized protein Gasu_23700 [Galdieria sulphuraria]EME30214.1 hypothetical protein Gasu_23700 [Galdieria sulphuraria]GJD08383.1 hypothetical protein Gasu2_26880 [Galdieria sulphuraria]|eukprot:XP_005706734.1 hypothetical protein Gasu_23700 [Galdieria sulphuraria]